MYGELIDISYAKSRVPRGTYIGDYSASWISGAINDVLAEQKARIGRFLTYDRLLRNLKSRAEGIKKINPKVGLSFLSRANSGIENQKRLEGSSLGIFAEIGAIKSNPIIQLMTTKEVDREIISSGILSRGQQLILNIKNLMSKSASLNSELERHEKNVKRLEKDIKTVEGELASRGIFRQATRIIGKPLDFLKYASIIVGGITSIILIPKIFPKKKEKKKK